MASRAKFVRTAPQPLGESVAAGGCSPRDRASHVIGVALSQDYDANALPDPAWPTILHLNLSIRDTTLGLDEKRHHGGLLSLSKSRTGVIKAS